MAVVVRNCFKSIDMTLGSACSSVCSTIGSIPGAIQRQLKDCCLTDCKVHGLIVLGRLLQAGAILGAGGTVFAAVMTGPMALLGIIPVIATTLLGTYMASRPSVNVYDAIAPLPPYVPKQPVGLINFGNNCWANASMQLLLRAPDVLSSPAAQRIPEVQQLAQMYAAAQGAQERVLRGADSRLIRSALQAVGRAHAGSVQEDPAQFFEYLFECPHSLYRMEMTIAGAPADQPRVEPMISFEISQHGGDRFDSLLFNYFNYQVDGSRAINLQFQTAPNDLFIQMKRFYQYQDVSRNQTVSGRNGNPISVPLRFTLHDRYSRDAQAANYECDGFIVQLGNSLDLGHYVAFIKNADNTWWVCDDSAVYPIAPEIALNWMAIGYIYHYRKVPAVTT